MIRFGAATAAYQIEGAVREGGRGPSIWDDFCALPGRVAGGDSGEVACDHYHRWRGDLDLMASLGLETYRFSIAWPRVQPDGRGKLNRRGVAFYRRLVEGLLERGIEPVATLDHWDLPSARQAVGGWASRDTAERFADYAALMGEQLGDVVTQWITHNEPWVVAFLGHAEGVKAPGIRDWVTALRASHHLLVSHGMAVGALRAVGAPGTQVGITLNLAPVSPASASEEDRAAALRMDGYLNRWFLDPVFRGRYPEDMVALFERRYGPLDCGAGRRPGADERADRLPRRQLLHAEARARPRSGTGRWASRTSTAARRRPRWGGRSTPTGSTRCSCGCGATTATSRSTSPRTARPTTTARSSTARSTTRSGRPTSRTTSPRSRGRSTTASTCSATTRGRCSTTSNGSTGTTSASGSCGWTTRRNDGSRSAAGLWYRDYIARARNGG